MPSFPDTQHFHVITFCQSHLHRQCKNEQVNAKDYTAIKT